MQSVFLVKIYEVLNSQFISHYITLLIVLGNTQKPQSCVCAPARIPDLMFRVALGNESTGEKRKTCSKRNEGSGLDFSAFN